MDERLFRTGGQQLGRLRRRDLPELARAIVAVYRGRAKAFPRSLLGVSWLLLRGNGVEVKVLASDWEKISPLVQEGALNYLATPPESGFAYLDPGEHFDIATLDQQDRQYFLNVLGQLQLLFTEEFPTSNL